MWNDEPELYRGKYYAKRGSGASTKRKSLRTERLDVALSRLVDLKRYDTEKLILISEIYAAYKEEKENKYKNLEYIWNCLSAHFGHLRPDQITRDICKKYIALRDVQNGTIIRELGALRAALKWYDPHNTAVFDFPSAPPPRHRYLTRTELSQLLKACTEPHIKLYIVLSICTAARKSALLELTWDNVDFERGQLILGKGTSNKRRATVPINRTAELALEEAYQARLSDNVIEYHGKPVKDVKRSFASTVKRSGLKDVYPHVLRHTSAVWMAEGRVPMSEISQYLGHSNTRVTERVYARYSPDYLRNAAETLELSSIELEASA